MNCPVCGTPTVAGARFCFACGSPLPGSGVADVEAERRVVTVLFGDLSDFTSWSEDLDPERVGVVTDRVLETLATAVTEFGGHVDKLTGDGLMAVFGAPTAHEDDAERAVRAAARMQQAVRRVVEEESGGGRRLGLRVGLNTGEVLAGVQAHLSYTVVGDTVNTAARLSDAAGVGGVLAGRETALATMDAASWRALSPLRLKGKREPVPAYELVRLRVGGVSRLGLGEDAPLVGRDAEFGQLVGRLIDVTERETPGIVVVSGEAGVGKTRLARELSRFADELPGARVLWGRCPPYGEGRDLASVADMVRTACGIRETDDVESARSRVARTVGRLEQASAPGALPLGMQDRIQALLGLEEVSAEPTREPAPGPGIGGEQVRQAVAALFTALAREGPLVLVVDDLHWATPTMLAGLLDVAVQVQGPVLALLLGRPDMLEVTLPGASRPWWEGVRDAELVPVLPLEDWSAERLLRAYLGAPAAELDEDVRVALLARAQGNPFFLAELLHLLVDRGVLRRVGSRWVLDGRIPEDLLPAGVQAVLAARIDELDGPAKGVLRDASVLGSRVTLGGLEAVGRVSGHGDPDVVRQAVATLVERRLLDPDSSPGSGESGYRFAHTLVRDVAYAGLAKAERARRHAAAAAYEAASVTTRTTEADAAAAAQGERAVSLAAEMGLPASDPAWAARGVAFPALARLGQAALARSDWATAERLLGRALGLAAPAAGEPVPDDLVLPVRVGRARALTSLHRLDEAEAECLPALEAGEDGIRAGALLVLGSIRRRRGDLAGASEAFVSGLAAASAAGIDRLAGEAWRQLGLLDYFEGRLRSAEERFRQAHALAVQIGDNQGAGWALQHLGWSATTRGDWALADAALGDAAEVFAEMDDGAGLAWVVGTEALLRLLQGQLHEVRRLTSSVLPLGEALGDAWGTSALRTIDAMAAAELGDAMTAAESAAVAGEQFTAIGDAWGRALALVAQGTAARALGDLGGAVRLLSGAVEAAATARHPLLCSLALVSVGFAQLEQGDPHVAGERAARAVGLLELLDLEPHARLGAQVLLAQATAARGEVHEALRQLDAVLPVSDAPALLFPLRQALAYRAEMLLVLGRAEEALSTAQSALDTPAEDIRSEVLALLALAAALDACGRPEEAKQARARADERAAATTSGLRHPA